ncbi:WG repeat-containing protein [Psychrobacter lutiphocae]|uniref:WG repeat-containing protein n=1 Tax=Psychrobacter lutiphocae TaxID=540500 RepID=UPI000366FC74|nr:WG repeat-containing protein [Psychrobacter lutiphocae]
MSNPTSAQGRYLKKHLCNLKASTAVGKFKSTLLKLGVVSAIMTAPLAAYACQVPNSYYSNVFCTASSQYFLALKDSGQPVALINKAGRPVADLTRYNGIDVNKLKDGLVPVQRLGKVGYIDMAGREVIPPIYDIISNDSQTKGWSRAVSNNRIVVKKDGKFGVIDTNNRVIVPFSANNQSISDYHGNMASIRYNNQAQWLDLNGRIINKQPAVSSSRQSIAIPVAASSGHSRVQANTQTATTSYPSVITSNKITIVNSRPTSTSSLPPDVATPIKPTNSGLTAAQSLGSSTTNRSSIQIINPTPLSSSSVPSTNSTTAGPNGTVAGLVAETIEVNAKPKPSSMDREIWKPEQRDGKWGFVNRTGIPMITFSFSQVTPFSEGLAGVRMQDKWGFVNLAGELVIPFDFAESAVHRGTGVTYKGVKPFVFTGGKAWVANMPNGTQMCINFEGIYVGC